MTDNQNDKHLYFTKIAWIIYTVVVIVVLAVLVLVVAQDNEERFFYGLMGAAVSYVFRPTDKFFNNLIYKFTGVAAPEAPEPTEPEPTEPEDPK